MDHYETFLQKFCRFDQRVNMLPYAKYGDLHGDKIRDGKWECEK